MVVCLAPPVQRTWFYLCRPSSRAGAFNPCSLCYCVILLTRCRRILWRVGLCKLWRLLSPAVAYCHLLSPANEPVEHKLNRLNLWGPLKQRKTSPNPIPDRGYWRYCLVPLICVFPRVWNSILCCLMFYLFVNKTSSEIIEDHLPLLSPSGLYLLPLSQTPESSPRRPSHV